MAYLGPYWAKFEGRGPACVEAYSPEAAIKMGERLTGRKVLSVESLPYPASPRISPEKSRCPEFCYSPDACAGHTACPKQFACSE